MIQQKINYTYNLLEADLGVSVLKSGEAEKLVGCLTGFGGSG